MVPRSARSLSGWALPTAAVFVVIALTVFRRWEPSDETWIYWFWARVFRESGGFVVLDRSPLYTLLITPFAWLPFPAVIVAEYFASTAVVGLSLIAFGHRFLGRWGAVLAAVVWIPILQIAEPPGQKLALAASLAAVLLRMRAPSRRSMVLSYGFLALAYFFRTTWLVLLVTFALYDAWRSLRSSGFRSLARTLIPRPRTDWPLLIPVLTLTLFLAMQSPHPWNNTFTATATWFPSKATSFTNGSGLALYNIAWVRERYPSVQDREDKDWYFTNRQAFGGATDVFGVIWSDPAFFARQLVRSTLLGINVTASQVVLDELVAWLPGGVAMEAFLLFGIGYAALRASRLSALEPFVIGNLLMLAVVVLAAGPRQRYMVVPLIPVLLLAATSWRDAAMRLLRRSATWTQPTRTLLAVVIIVLMAAYLAFLISRVAMARYVPVGPLTVAFLTLLGCAGVFALLRPARAAHLVGRVALPASIVLLSLGLTSWESVLGDIWTGARTGDLRVMERSDYSVTGAEAQLSPLLRGCNGIMAGEYRFIGAFLDVPLDRVHDHWEIPPFGRLDASEYDGLRPARVDCVVVSKDLVTDVGESTNQRVRYENYIRPYVDRLLADGAQRYEIADLGTVVTAAR